VEYICISLLFVATSNTSPFKLSTWWYLPIFCSLQHAIACYTVLFRVSYPISKSSPWLVNRVYHAEHVCFKWNNWFSHDDREINPFLLTIHPQIVLHVSGWIATTSPLHHRKWDLGGSILPLWPNIPDIMISSFLSGWIMHWVPGEQLSASFPKKYCSMTGKKDPKSVLENWVCLKIWRVHLGLIHRWMIVVWNCHLGVACPFSEPKNLKVGINWFFIGLV
jgi:hypothetical protein